LPVSVIPTTSDNVLQICNLEIMRRDLVKIVLSTIVAIFISSQRLQAQTAPPRAKSAGFNTLVWHDEFDSLDVAPRNIQTGHKWYASVPTRAKSTGLNSLIWHDEFDSLDVSVKQVRTDHKWYARFKDTNPSYSASNGILTMVWTWKNTWGDIPILMSNVNKDSANMGTGVFLYGYVEARMRCDMPKGAWPAFWLNSTLNNNPNSELDIFEGLGETPDVFYGTIHSWAGNRIPEDGSQMLIKPKIASGFTDWHTIGFLWIKGKVEWYFDDMFIGSLPTYPINDIDPQCVIFDACGNGWGTNKAAEGTKANLQVDWVRVWQGEGSK